MLPADRLKASHSKGMFTVMKDTIRFGVIGLGARGMGCLEYYHCTMEGVKVTHVCDIYEDRTLQGQQIVERIQGHKPAASTDYRKVIEDPNVDAVVIMSSWDNHVPATVAAMRAGKFVASEVGGAYSVDDCWELIRAYEDTGRHVMFLENCCYGTKELMALHMAKQGFFGKIVACEGGYCHDLRSEILYGEENRHYRLRNYMHRNCENYPTHELGPIAKILGINRGNRMLTLSSMASGSWGLNEYARTHDDVNPALREFRFAQGDIISTNIKCAGGELITLTLDTTLPRHYSRRFTVRGTKAAFFEPMGAVFEDTKGEHGNEKMNNLAPYAEEYMHPMWRRYLEEGVQGGHDGFDWLTYCAFADYVRSGDVPPIDTYDMAAWMAITPLSELSIANGGAPVEVPDFTRGAWTHRTDVNRGPYSLDI